MSWSSLRLLCNFAVWDLIGRDEGEQRRKTRRKEERLGRAKRKRWRKRRREKEISETQRFKISNDFAHGTDKRKEKPEESIGLIVSLLFTGRW